MCSSSTSPTTPSRPGSRPSRLNRCSRSSASFSKRRTVTFAPASVSPSGTPSMRVPGLDRMAVRAGLRVADRGQHARLEYRRHRVLEPLGLLVDVVPRDLQHVGEEALDQAVAADDRLGLLEPLGREGDRLVGGAGDVAVLLQPADHLVHGRRGELHRARHVGAGDRQAGLVQPEDRLQVFVFGNRRAGHTIDRTWLQPVPGRASRPSP